MGDSKCYHVLMANHLLRLTDDLSAAARSAAERHGTPLSKWLEQAVREKLDRDRPRYARPGREPVVIPSLADLHGPTEGVVTLPQYLYWSTLGRKFDLADEADARLLYETVLREASRAEHLARYLNEDRLISLWPKMHLKGIRDAWEDKHPALRTAVAA